MSLIVEIITNDTPTDWRCFLALDDL